MKIGQKISLSSIPKVRDREKWINISRGITALSTFPDDEALIPLSHEMFILQLLS